MGSLGITLLVLERRNMLQPLDLRSLALVIILESRMVGNVRANGERLLRLESMSTHPSSSPQPCLNRDPVA